MSEKIYIRKCEKYTIWEATEPFEVDVEKLRQCEPPYEGETPEDLITYLTENIWENWDETFIDDDHNKQIYGEDELYRLTMEEEYDAEVYSDSRTKFGDSWYELGQPNEEYRKTGRFQSMADNGDWG